MVLVSSISKDFPPGVRQRGDELDRYGAVRLVHGDPFNVSAIVHGTQPYSVQLEREKTDLYVTCECPYFVSEGACKHIWATIIAADRKGLLLGHNGRPPVRIIEDWMDDFGLPEELLQPSVPKPHAAPAKHEPDWRGLLAQAKYLDEVHPRATEPWRTDREVYYNIDVPQTQSLGEVYLEVAYRDRKKNGEWGKVKNTRIPRQVLPQIPDGPDREILTILGGAPDPNLYGAWDSIPAVYRLRSPLIEMMMPRICATGRCRLRTITGEDVVQNPAVQWDDGAPWTFAVHVERKGDSWIVRGYLQRAGDRMDVSEPNALLQSGLMIARHTIARLEHSGQFGWIQMLRRLGRIVVPAKDQTDFINKVLTETHAPKIEWPEELKFEQVTGDPRPHLHLGAPRINWNQSGVLSASLAFEYDGVRIPAEDPGSGHFDADGRRFVRRNDAAEQAAREALAAAGVKPQQRYFGSDSQYEISQKRLPQVVRDLLRAGWHIEAEGKTFRRPSSFRAELSSGVDWFELHGEVDYGDNKVQLPQLLKALKQGANMIQLGDGSYGMVPEDLLDKYGLLFGLGTAQKDHVRFSRAQTGLLDAILASRDDIDFDETFGRARDQLKKFERIEPAAQPAGFAGELRGYQREGLAWMEFLREIGFGGCLADDMGVGKTPQVLALLENRRAAREADPSIGPSLVVVPRSLIYNWQQESARFTPKLRVLDHSGIGRSKDLQHLQNFDVVLTTYGTLRRDAVDFQDIRFDYVILDEAQAIKNSESESAKAARILQADHRLVMTGTPIENHLGELWSLFEFLNPGMLGSMSALSLGGKAMRNPGEETRELLARAVRPYILRRTKAQVAPELPPKSEQTIYCELDAKQRKLYNDLRDHYRQSLLGRIEENGMAKSKMQILEALLRLRQAACHPGLLDKERTNESSAKLEALIPQLAEVTEERHKVLVFSQFTSLLSIVRGHLDRASMTYEYLDGQTRDRQARVERFQNDPDCKLFLISLKAGGVGLNLTAAEYVFLLDPWWNPAVEAQAIDRAHRIGQSEHVFAYRLIARDTVEEKVLELQNTKRDLADSIIRADANLVRNLKREDLEFLFS